MRRHCITYLLCLFAMITHAQSIHTIELLKNPSFEEEAKPIRNRRFGSNGEGELFGAKLPEGTIPGWMLADNRGERSQIVIITENLLDTIQHKALLWKITEAPATLSNVGIQGFEVIRGTKYTLTFWARADKIYKGRIHVGLQSRRDATWYAQTKVRRWIKKGWKKYTITFVAEENSRNTRFVITADKPGTLYLDEVSLSESYKR